MGEAMTNNQTIDGVTRDRLELCVKALASTGYTFESNELRAMLDAPECKTCGGSGYVVEPFSIRENTVECPTCKPAARPQGEPVVVEQYRVVRHDPRDEKYSAWFEIESDAKREQIANNLQLTSARGLPAVYELRKLYEQQPAPVAGVLPEDWQNQLFAEMERRFELRKNIDDDHMVIDDTQIGVEFACEWIAKRINTRRPTHANPPPGAEPSGTHPHNDGLDEMRKPKMCDCNREGD